LIIATKSYGRRSHSHQQLCHADVVLEHRLKGSRLSRNGEFAILGGLENDPEGQRNSAPACG
jgi:hypothetical protein